MEANLLRPAVEVCDSQPLVKRPSRQLPPAHLARRRAAVIMPSPVLRAKIALLLGCDEYRRRYRVRAMVVVVEMYRSLLNRVAAALPLLNLLINTDLNSPF